MNELVRLHGGEVEVASALGRGSSFHVRLPIGPRASSPRSHRRRSRPLARGVRADAFIEEALTLASRLIPRHREPKSSTISTNAESEHIQSRRPTVLLADDNADMREYVRRLLGARFVVLTAQDGEAALYTALRNTPDLVSPMS